MDQLANGESATAVGKHFSIYEATMTTIKKNETAIRKSVCSGIKTSVKEMDRKSFGLVYEGKS